MAHRQSFDAASTRSTLRGLPAYSSRAPSIAGSEAPSTLPPPFSDSASVVPSYNTNASAVVNIWDLRRLESYPDIYDFSIGSRPEPEDQPWLKWSIFTRSSDTGLVKPNYPRYVGGDDVACTVAFNLSEPKHVSSITVVLRGKYITSSLQGTEGDYTFLTSSHAVDITSVRRGDGTLPAGTHEYELRFPFPVEVNLLDSLPQNTAKGKGPLRSSETTCAVFSSPQTTLDTNGTIEYDLTLIIEHGKLFKRSAKLRTRVMFIPSIIPDPPSILRQTAYKNCVWAPDPIRDPAGWTSITPIVLRGAFEGREEVVKYTVSLANPLSYTRGSFIPVHLDIASENTHLLEVLSKRECHDIHLICETAVLLRPEREMSKHLKAVAEQTSGKGSSQAFPPHKISSLAEIVSDVCFADDAPAVRQLEKAWPSISLKGEIHLSRSLLPSSDFVAFSVQYKVQVNPPTDSSGRFANLASFSETTVAINVATQFAPKVERPMKMLRGHSSSRRKGSTVTPHGAYGRADNHGTFTVF